MEVFIGVQNDESIKQYQNWEMDEEIQIFREYLRIPSVHPDINYGEKVFAKFRKSQNSSELFVAVALKVHIIFFFTHETHAL